MNMSQNLVENFFGSSERCLQVTETSNVLSLYDLQHAEAF